MDTGLARERRDHLVAGKRPGACEALKELAHLRFGTIVCIF